MTLRERDGRRNGNKKQIEKIETERDGWRMFGIPENKKVKIVALSRLPSHPMNSDPSLQIRVHIGGDF